MFPLLTRKNHWAPPIDISALYFNSSQIDKMFRVIAVFSFLQIRFIFVIIHVPSNIFYEVLFTIYTVAEIIIWPCICLFLLFWRPSHMYNFRFYFQRVPQITVQIYVIIWYGNINDIPSY